MKRADVTHRRRRWLRWVLGGVIGVVALAAIVVGPRVYDAMMLLRQGDEIDVGGGREVFVHCRGTGSPTVLLEHGLGSNGHEWRTVQGRASNDTRVCFTSRAGMGFSDPAGADQRTALDAVHDLRAIIDAGAVEGPFVLVGHSYGGLVVRLFADHYPDEVVGMVLVDSMHEQQLDLMRTRLEPTSWDEVDALLAANPERMDLLTSSNLVRASGDLDDLPLVVLEAADAAPETDGLSAATADDLVETMSQLWPELQADLARRSTAGEHRVVENTGHFIQRDQPSAVVAAIQDVVHQTAR